MGPESSRVGMGQKLRFEAGRWYPVRRGYRIPSFYHSVEDVSLYRMYREYDRGGRRERRLPDRDSQGWVGGLDVRRRFGDLMWSGRRGRWLEFRHVDALGESA
jgi:hypothetical protein